MFIEQIAPYNEINHFNLDTFYRIRFSICGDFLHIWINVYKYKIDLDIISLHLILQKSVIRNEF